VAKFTLILFNKRVNVRESDKKIIFLSILVHSNLKLNLDFNNA